MMKKLFLAILIVIGLEGYSQFSVDFQTTQVNLIPIKLNNTETKYLDQPLYWYDQTQFSLYNLDGTLYKTIQLPPKPDTSSWIEVVDFVTTNLFDNDPSTIEYLIHYDPCDSTISGAPWRVEIVREDGMVLLNEPYASFSYLQVYNTEQGSKLMLPYFSGNSSLISKTVYSLPGELPSNTEENLVGNRIQASLYPNPNIGKFYIDVNLKEGESAEFLLYSITGKLIGSFQSKSKITQINEFGLSNGIYLINTTTSQGSQQSKLIIQK